MSVAPLIVDVGMHHGDDTAYYLAKGFRVLAIEANPELVGRAQERFAEPLAEGDLEIRHLAVTDYVGETTFFVGAEELWGSTTREFATRGIGDGKYREVTVPCAPLSTVLADYPVPHYVKIDVEGRDADCVRSLRDSKQLPRYLSYETDLSEPDETRELVNLLSDLGYQKFKLMNQALLPRLRPTSPSLEGAFVDTRFTGHMSGPFGQETPGAWRSPHDVLAAFGEIARRQAVRTSYGQDGRVFGLRVGVAHRLLKRIYNNPVVAEARVRWAQKRGIEPGGWFDLHASLD